MRRFVGISTALLAVVALLVPLAQADVARYQTMTFKLATDVGPGIDQHNYTMAYNPCDGTVQGTGSDTVLGYNETLACTLAGVALSCDGVYVPMGGAYDGYEFTYAALLDPLGSTTTGTAEASGASYSTSFTVSNVAMSTWKNHGAFVSASPNKNDAAHSCIGMPIQSKK